MTAAHTPNEQKDLHSRPWPFTVPAPYDTRGEALTAFRRAAGVIRQETPLAAEVVLGDALINVGLTGDQVSDYERHLIRTIADQVPAEAVAAIARWLTAARMRPAPAQLPAAGDGVYPSPEASLDGLMQAWHHHEQLGVYASAPTPQERDAARAAAERIEATMWGEKRGGIFQLPGLHLNG